MKKLVLILVVTVFSLLAHAQMDTICGLIPIKDKKVCYEGVVVGNYSASTIYSNAKVWVASNFGSAGAVIQTDVVNTSLVLKGILKEDEYTTYNFTLTLQFKDGRYKYTLTDLYYYFMTVENPVENMPFMSSCIEKTVIDFNTFFTGFIDRIEKGIKQDNNW